MIRRWAGFLLVRGIARIIWRVLRVTVFVAAMIAAAPVVAGRGLLGHAGVVPRLAAAPAVPRGGVVPADGRGLAGGDGRGRPALVAGGRGPVSRLAGHVARGRGRRLPEGRGDGGAGGHPARPAGRRRGLVLAHLHHGDGQRRAGAQRPGRLRPAAMAAPGAHGPGPDQRARLGAVAAAGRERGRRGHDPDGAPPGPAAGRPPLPPAALAPGGAGHDGHREDHLAAEVVGRVHDPGDGTARGGAAGRARCWWCWTARAAPTRGGSPTGPAGCCAARAPRPRPSGPTRPACRCGRCRPASSSAPWWTWSSRAPAVPPTTPTSSRRSSGWRWTPPAGRPPARPISSGGWTRAGWRWPTRATPDGGSAGLLQSSAGHVSDVALRYRALMRRLGSGLDGPGGFGDADAWYCILEGTAEIAVAEAQARALVDLLAWFAAGGSGPASGDPAGHPARGGRVQRRVPAAAHLAALRAGPLARPGRAGVGPVLAGAGRR